LEPVIHWTQVLCIIKDERALQAAPVDQGGHQQNQDKQYDWLHEVNLAGKKNPGARAGIFFTS
jgi:hypothetical protein